MLLDRHRPSHRWYHVGRYGFTGPYPEVLVPGGNERNPAIPYRYQYFSLYPRNLATAYASQVEEPEAVELAEGPGIRDVEEILARAREDELDAVEARVRYRADGLPILEVDGPVAERLRPTETVVDFRQAAVVSRHMRDDDTDQFPGRLYLTTQRLMVVGHGPLDVELSQIDELGLAGERLLVTLRDGTGLSIDASRPRLLRVQISAALAAGRS